MLIKEVCMFGRKLFRVISWIMILSFLIFVVMDIFDLNITEPFETTFSEPLTTLQWIDAAWSLFLILGFFLWGCCLLGHCVLSEFTTKNFKVMWLIVITIGMGIFGIGPLVYYFVVIEKRKYLRE